MIYLSRNKQYAPKGSVLDYASDKPEKREVKLEHAHDTDERCRACYTEHLVNRFKRYELNK